MVALLAAEPPDEGGAIATFRVERRGDVLTLPVSVGDVLTLPDSVGDASYPFILDTGASIFGFDEARLEHRLKRTTATENADTGAGVIEMPIYQSPPLRLGPIALGCNSPSACRKPLNSNALHGEC